MKTDQSIGVIPFFKEKNEYKFLIIQQAFGDWIFPKGHSVGKETDRETILRELYEETNITGCELKKDFNYELEYFFGKNNNRVEKRVRFFLGSIDNSQIEKISPKNSNGEVLSLYWFSYKNAIERLTHENQKIMLKKVFKYLKENSK